MLFFFFKQKTAYEMRISDWSSDVCSSDLAELRAQLARWTLHRLAQAQQGQRHAARHVDGRNLERGIGDVGILPIGEIEEAQRIAHIVVQIGRASCRARVCQYV